jgi:peptidyl-prolyl cis-trans isomerase C
MKIARLPLALCAVLAAGAIHAADDTKPAAAAPPAASPAEVDVTLATINGVRYSLDTFRLFYLERMQQSQSGDTPEMQQQAFNEFINLALTAQQADALKLTDRHDVQVGLELQRMRVLSNVALQSMAQEFKPTEDELKKAYDDAVKQLGQTQYKVRHILVKDEAEGKKVIAELNKGGDFAELAKKYSTGPNAKSGGELGWFTSAQIDNKPFSDAVEGLKKGGYTKTPVNAKYGWHVILLEDTRIPEPPSFDDAKPQLIANYQRAKLGEKIGALREAAKLDLNESVVKLKEPAAEEPAKDAPEKTEKK